MRVLGNVTGRDGGGRRGGVYWTGIGGRRRWSGAGFFQSWLGRCGLVGEVIL